MLFPVRGALFDLDGVLVDTEGLYTEFWAEIGRNFGIPDPDFALTIKGNNLERILTSYFPDREIQNEIVERLNRFQASMPYTLFDGALSLIHDLREAGWRCAIVTSSDRRKMESLYASLPVLEQVMDVIVTGDMVSHSKPDPEGYLTAARFLGADPKDCIVFEDSIAGLAAGMASGAKVVGLATTNPMYTLQGLADHIFPSIAAISMPDLVSL